MDDKVTLQYLIELFSKENRMAKDKGDSFVKAFFDLIREGLEKDRIVKIKGLGTFKIIDIEPRESVNVNTGERFQIEGHSKVSFTPDASLKEIVNQPFADFETVILNEGVSFDNREELDLKSGEDATHDASDGEDTTEDEAVADNEQSDVEVTTDTETLEDEQIGSDVNDNEETEESITAKIEEVANNELPDNETASDNSSETPETGSTAVEDGISEPVLSAKIAEAESLIKELQTEQPIQETETPDSTEDTTFQEISEEKITENTQLPEMSEAKPLAQEAKQAPISEEQNEEPEVKPAATETKDTLQPDESSVDKIIANELMQVPTPKISYNKKENGGISKKKKKRMSINPSVAMGILTVLIIGAFGIIVYWMLAPEPTDTEIKPLYNQSSSSNNKDAMAGDSLSNDKDTLTLAEKALLLAQQDQATDSDDSNKIRTAMMLLNAERNKKVPAKKASKAEKEKIHKLQQAPTKVNTPTSTQKQGNKVIIKELKTTHVMAKGENLYTIAKKYLGSKDKVKYLIKYNNFKNPDLVKIGTKVRIPALSE